MQKIGLPIRKSKTRKEKKTLEENQEHINMETIGSGKTDKWVNVREKLGKMRNVSC